MDQRADAEISWFSALCDDDYRFLGVDDPGLKASWSHCRNITLAAEANGGVREWRSAYATTPDELWPQVHAQLQAMHGELAAAKQEHERTQVGVKTVDEVSTPSWRLPRIVRPTRHTSPQSGAGGAGDSGASFLSVSFYCLVFFAHCVFTRAPL